LKVDAIVIEAVYPTIEIATRNRLQKYLGPLGVRLAPLLLWQLQPRLGVSVDQLRPIEHIAEVGCPIFIISGEKDQNTLRSDTEILFERAHSPKELWFVPSAGHVDLHHVAGGEYERRVLAFLRLAGI
jgi:uncharacterized protein